MPAADQQPQFTITSKVPDPNDIDETDDDNESSSSDEQGWNQYNFDDEDDDDAPELVTECKLERREAAPEPTFEFPRNLYHGEID